MLLARASRSVRNAAISAGVGKTHHATKSATPKAIAVTPSVQNVVRALAARFRAFRAVTAPWVSSSYGFQLLD